MDNYPTMSRLEWANAPWNQLDNIEKEFEVTISQTLSKDTKVLTRDYKEGIDYPETEWDTDGYHTVMHKEADDTSDTNWRNAYKQEHLTPLEIIAEFRELLISNKRVKKAKRDYLIEECSNWVEDDLEVCEG